MEIAGLHRLLRRQIKKHHVDQQDLDRLNIFFDSVNEAYISADKDVNHLENILEKSSQELYKASQLLKKDIEIKTAENHQTKLQLERVVNNVRNVIFQTNLKGEIIYLNSAWEELTGYEVKESIGKSYEEFFHNADQKGYIPIPVLIKKQAEHWQRVFRIYSKSGEEKWIDLSFRITRDNSGVVDGTIGNIVDVTKLKQSEIKLRKAQEKLKSASQAKEVFLSTMSHEIRTPLNGVIGMTNILMMEEHLPRQIDNLNTLLFSAEHLLGLINDLIDINKIESGKIEFESAEFNFETMLLGIRKTFSYQAEEKGICFKIKKDDSIPPILVGDGTRLLQVLTNLIGNALKFTKEGKIILDMEVQSATDDSISIHFEIIDSGIGIKAENIDKIFERFSQAESSTTRQFGGTGLGLTICKSLLEQQASDLMVASEFGKGSTFSFSLTFKKSKRFDVEAPKFMDLQPSYSGMDGFKVLVAEDNAVNVMVIERLFNKWDIDFRVANNGAEALDFLDREDFDLILMDIQMPIMDGYTAAKEIRSRKDPKFQTIPIIALTASAEISIQNKAQEVGMNDFMSKPFNPVKLYRKLKAYSKKTFVGNSP
ncbi:MAG: response regulator [Saprospiraceae bacterium]|nr:response regulator [Saprospiraceae bacterium]